MNKKTSLMPFICCVAMFGCQSGAEANSQQADSGWNLVWNDEFSSKEIDREKWSFAQDCWGGGNNEAQCYTSREANAFQEDGALVIRAVKEQYSGAALPKDNPAYSPNDLSSKPYTSARLLTKGKGDWKYGKIEVRAKLPSGQGTWPAIWMLPTDNVYGTWAASGEIDIVESVNLKVRTPGSDTEESKVHGTLHYGGNWPENVNSGTSYQLPNDINPADDFHVYSVEWSKGKIRWLVDGIHYATQTSDGWYTQYKNAQGQLVTGKEDAPFNERFHLILNLAVGGSWAGSTNAKGIDENAFPARMEVDYVRVYECTKESGECSSSNDSGKLIQGKKAPVQGKVSLDFVSEKLVDIYSGHLSDGLTLGAYKHAGNSTFKEKTIGGERLIEIVRTGPDGNFYITLPQKTDLSAFAQRGEVVFDLRIKSREPGSELLVKIDSGWPVVSDYNVPMPELNEWEEIRIPVKTILKGGNRFAPGNFVDISSVLNAFVLEPTAGMVYQVKNIRWENM